MISAAMGVEFSLDGSPTFRRDPLSPKAKYVLMQIALRSEDRLCEHGYEELARRFGMSKQRMSAALKELVEQGILEMHPKPEGRGRPINLYRLASRVWQLLRGAQWSDMVAGERHRLAIERLLNDSKGEPLSGVMPAGADNVCQTGQLAIEDRLLLCTLLCHADRHGVVRVLSAADLRKLTGFKSDALKDRLGSFIERGLIRAYVPGVTSSALFGKAKSVYYLNLQHPLFASSYPLAGLMIYGWLEHSVVNAYDLHQQLCVGRQELDERLRSFRRNGKPDVQEQDLLRGQDAQVLVASIGAKPEGTRVLPILQARLEFYASWLLSSCWSGLEDRDFPCPSALADVIKGDFVDVRQKEKAEVSRVADALVGYIYMHARRLAQEVRQNLLRVLSSECGRGIACQELDYQILPRNPAAKIWTGRPDDQWFRAVLIFPKTRPVSLGCHIAKLDRTREPIRYEAEADIPLGQRYRFGLLAPVKLAQVPES